MLRQRSQARARSEPLDIKLVDVKIIVGSSTKDMAQKRSRKKIPHTIPVDELECLIEEATADAYGG
jgi:hypothetical protein